MTYSQIIADCIITKMYEYLLSYQYINTVSEVHQKEALKRMKLTSNGRILVNIMSYIRNYDIHNPIRLTNKLRQNFNEAITTDSIKDVTWFYLFPEQAVKFLKYQAGISEMEESSIFS